MKLQACHNINSPKTEVMFFFLKELPFLRLGFYLTVIENCKQNFLCFSIGDIYEDTLLKLWKCLTEYTMVSFTGQDIKILYLMICKKEKSFCFCQKEEQE